MRAVIVGSGAGGATAARELVRSGFEVLVLEAGSAFKPFTRRLSWTKPFRRVGLLGKEKNITKIFPHIATTRSSSDLALFRGYTSGGSTAISCGNLVRAQRGLKEIGLDLAAEFEELEKLIGIQTIPKNRWRPTTKDMFGTAEKLGLNPKPTPKAVDVAKCVSCGLCEIGCATGARWDSRQFIDGIEKQKLKLETDSPVRKILFEKDKLKGVEVGSGKSFKKINCDLVVLAAGGIGTAQILKASDFEPKDKLWVDIVLTLGGVSSGAKQLKEPPMVWFIQQKDHIISPYIDILSHWFHKPWRKVPLENRVGVMVKLADTENGRIGADGSVVKELTEKDRNRLDLGIKVTQDIMENAGVSGPFVHGMLNGGHLGGTVPLTKSDISSMKPSWLPDGLWVADLSLIPRAQGLPTMLTTAAISLKVTRKIIESVQNK